MKYLPKKEFFYSVILVLILFASLSASQAVKFDTMVVPSLMDSDMDGWYKIPPNSGPNIHKAYSVYRDQIFNLLIFFRGYTADKENKLHIRYDVQVYDPMGNPTDDKKTDVLAYHGPLGNPEALVLNQQYLKIVLTEKYQLGTYKIKVTAYDKISGDTFTSETPIELVPFTFPAKFESQEKAGAWIMDYYLNPTPVKAISCVQTIIQPNPEWLGENLNILTFFRRIFSDNPFLFKNIAKHFNSFPVEDQKKFLIIAAISDDSALEPLISDSSHQKLKKMYNIAKGLKFLDISREINSAVQLDILWSEFLTTGKYDPIRKIVSALSLNKYKGTLEKIKTGQIELTSEIEKAAHLEATHRSAVWSLISNCKQMPLVFKYCVFIYENEDLDESIKNQLGAILSVAQEEINKKSETTKSNT